MQCLLNINNPLRLLLDVNNKPCQRFTPELPQMKLTQWDENDIESCKIFLTCIKSCFTGTTSL